MKMKAAVMYGPNDIRYEDVEKATCPEGGFLLKVEAVGLCGSDIRNLTTDSRKGAYPHVFGHEQVGFVVEAAKGMTDFAVGDRVYVYPLAPCMKCEFCRAGDTANCLNPDDYTQRQGGFADYIGIVPKQINGGSVYVIPEGVDFELATLGEPLSSVYACQDNIDVKLGDTVAILGAGPIGCFNAQVAKLRGAFTVIMIEVNDARLEKAREFGVDHVVNSTREDPVEAVRALTRGLGADKVISANPSIEAQAQSVYMTKKGGIAVFFGGVAKGSKAEIDTNYAHYNNIWMYGNFGASASQVRKAFELAISPRFPAKRFISHVMPLGEINEALRLTRTGEALKVVLKP